jgi:uncharacterized membrane protein YuzA (DUF378 family)
MKKMGFWGWIIWALVVIGAINWGLVGFFNWNLVGAIFGGDMVTAARVVYAIVGLAGLAKLIWVFIPKKD